MKTASPFHNISEGTSVRVIFDGTPLDLPEGMNLAAALLAAGVTSFRNTPVSGAPRAPFCMMGACYECLVGIDGVNQQACMLEVREGLEITRAHKSGEVSHDN